MINDEIRKKRKEMVWDYSWENGTKCKYWIWSQINGIRKIRKSKWTLYQRKNPKVNSCLGKFDRYIMERLAKYVYESSLYSWSGICGIKFNWKIIRNSSRNLCIQRNLIVNFLKFGWNCMVVEYERKWYRI